MNADTTAPAERATRLIKTTGLDHGPTCGDRVACPVCGLVNGNYRPAEQQVRGDTAFIRCNRCKRSWRVAA